MKETEVNIDRLELGEAWAWCAVCNAKLTEFDGDQDVLVPCPHPKKCKDEKR